MKNVALFLLNGHENCSENLDCLVFYLMWLRFCVDILFRMSMRLQTAGKSEHWQIRIITPIALFIVCIVLSLRRSRILYRKGLREEYARGFSW